MFQNFMLKLSCRQIKQTFQKQIISNLHNFSQKIEKKGKYSITL